MLKANDKNTFAEVTGPNGGDADAAVCKAPTDADPSNGTSDRATSITMMAKRALGRWDRRSLLDGGL